LHAHQLELHKNWPTIRILLTFSAVTIIFVLLISIIYD
jgi:hypothetical protein